MGAAGGELDIGPIPLSFELRSQVHFDNELLGYKQEDSFQSGIRLYMFQSSSKGLENLREIKLVFAL